MSRRVLAATALACALAGCGVLPAADEPPPVRVPVLTPCPPEPVMPAECPDVQVYAGPQGEFVTAGDYRICWLIAGAWADEWRACAERLDESAARDD